MSVLPRLNLSKVRDLAKTIGHVLTCNQRVQLVTTATICVVVSFTYLRVIS